MNKGNTNRHAEMERETSQGPAPKQRTTDN